MRSIVGFLESHPKLTWILVFLYAGFIYYTSAQSVIPQPRQLEFKYSDLIEHAAVYSILGFLLFAGFVGIRTKSLNPTYSAVNWGVFYAITDELHQHFVPGRHADVLDLALDATGIFLGVVLAQHFSSWGRIRK